MGARPGTTWDFSSSRLDRRQTYCACTTPGHQTRSFGGRERIRRSSVSAHGSVLSGLHRQHVHTAKPLTSSICIDHATSTPPRDAHGGPGRDMPCLPRNEPIRRAVCRLDRSIPSRSSCAGQASLERHSAQPGVLHAHPPHRRQDVFLLLPQVSCATLPALPQGV